MLPISAGAPSYTLTPLPEKLRFLDNSYIRVAIVVGTIALVCFAAQPLLVAIAPLTEILSLVHRGITFIGSPLLYALEQLPRFGQIVFSIAVAVGGYYSIDAVKGGIDRWSAFWNPQNWQNKALFLGTRLLTLPFRNSFPSSLPPDVSVLGRTLVEPLAQSLVFDVVLSNGGAWAISHISDPPTRAVAERIHLLAVPILCGLAFFVRAPKDRLFVGVIQGVYGLCTYLPASGENGFLGGCSARLAHETFMSFFAYVIGAICRRIHT